MGDEYMEHVTQKDLAMHVSKKSMVANGLLTAFKLFAGIFAHSSAMVSDAIHSASDIFSTVLVMAGVSMASKEADKGHPYGHDRLECIVAMLLAMLLFATGLGIGYSGLMKVLSGLSGNLEVPGLLALFAAVTSIGVKEWMFRFTRTAAKTVNSGALMADAWHHRSDAISSIGSLVGIAGARMGFPILDPLACLVICLFIVKASYDIFIDAVSKVTDCSVDDETVAGMEKLILAQEGVLSLDLLNTRMFGAKLYVDVEVGADSQHTLGEGHTIAEAVHNAIEAQYPHVKHCMVHVNPVDVPENTTT